MRSTVHRTLSTLAVTGALVLTGAGVTAVTAAVHAKPLRAEVTTTDHNLAKPLRAE